MASSECIAGMAIAASLVLIIVQGAGVTALVLDSDAIESQSQSNELMATEEGMLTVSPSENIIVIILDTYDNDYLIEAVNQYPDLLGEFTGFTWYQNVTGSYIPTRHAIPFLLTGVKAERDTGWFDWVRHRYEESYLPALYQAGYSVGVYSNDMRLEYSSSASAINEVMTSCINLKTAGSIVELDRWNMLIALSGCALYRDCPWVLKPLLQFDTPSVKAAMVADSKSYDPAKTAYVYDDAKFFEKLKKNRLRVEEDAGTGAFRFIHLMGAHEPYLLDQWGNYSGDSTRIESCAGSIRMVQEYLKQLKDLSVYDNSTIIVTADHGRWYVTMDDIEEPSTPIIFVKPSVKYEEKNEAIVQSNAPVAHEDIIPTILQSAGLSSERYSGKSLLEYTGAENPLRDRYYYTTQESASDYYDRRVVEWLIKGDAEDFQNWEKTGFAFDADDRFVRYEIVRDDL